MKKKLKYGINSSVLVIGVIAVIVALNILVSAVVDKFPIKIDLTSQKMYEISDSTYEFLKTYETPTTIYILSAEASEDMRIKNVLEKYAQTNHNIKIENIDMSANPTFGQKYLEGNDKLTANSVIIDAGERFKVYRQIDFYNTTSDAYGTQYLQGMIAEQKITAGLKYVSSAENFKAYFVQGHNEIELAGAKTVLKNENYETADLNLLTEDIPGDAKMIVVGNPTVDFTMAELEKLDRFFAGGGKGQFFFYMSANNLPNLYGYLKQWGIQVNDDIVIEQNIANQARFTGTSLSLIIPELNDAEITSSIKEAKRSVAYMPFAKSLTTLFESNNGTTVTPILSSSQSAYTTTDMENAEKTESSRTGNLVVGAVAVKEGTSPSEDASVFVSGTTLMLEQDKELLDQFGLANGDLYMNVTKYMQGSQEDYSVPAKSFTADKITISGVDYLLLIVVVGVLPIIALITGIVVWFRRRHL